MGKGMKTRNAAKKRFKVTGSGKIVRRNARAAHLLTKKSRKQKRTMGNEQEISSSDAQVLRRMLPSK